MSIGFTIRGQEVGLGWIIALLVLVICVVLWAISRGHSIELGLIAALALAYLLG